MDYSIVYNTHTGNTEILAEAIREIFVENNCLYFGKPGGDYTHTLMVFVGFWTYKRTCDDKFAEFLKTMRDKIVFLFGTAGFGGNQEYYENILKTLSQHLDSSNVVVGEYMCQGKNASYGTQRYVNKLTGTEEDSKYIKMIDNFDHAAAHPDKSDCDEIKKQVINIVSKLK